MQAGRVRQRVALQRKGVLDTPGDRHEREADRQAAQVVNGSGPPDLAGARSGVGKMRSRPGRVGGRPLAPGVRRSMEAGFDAGTDFGGVRVHTDDRADQLSRTLAARSFTQGQDIYFRRGEYNAASGEGRTLLAHELAHVVQQSAYPAAGSMPSIQRKVGFEFETGIGNYGWMHKTAVLQSRVPSSDPTAAAGARSWEAVNDSGGLEFVTQAFELDAAGFAQLSLVMNDIASFMAQYETISGPALEGLLDANPSPVAAANEDQAQLDLAFADQLMESYRLSAGQLAQIGNIDVRTPDFPALAHVKGYTESMSIATPQATVGLPLDRVPVMLGSLPIENLGSQLTHPRHAPPERDISDNSLIGGYPLALLAVVEGQRVAVAEAKELKQLEPHLDPASYGRYAGFLSLVLSYVINGQTQLKEWAYAKIIAPAMARTALSKLLGRMVDPQLAAHFDWTRVRPLLRQAGCDVDDGTLLFPKGVENWVEGGRLTVKEWIESLRTPNLHGNDVLSDVEESMHKYDVADLEPSPDGPLVLLELRYLPRYVNPADWKGLSQRILLVARKWRNAAPVDI